MALSKKDQELFAQLHQLGIEKQKKEIETIQPRSITLALSDADCDRLAARAGAMGLTPGELLENFVGDLVNGTYSNGSDEREYANNYVDRCWFSHIPNESLLQSILAVDMEDQSVQEFVELYDALESDRKDLDTLVDDATAHAIYNSDEELQEIIEEERASLKDDIAYYQKRLQQLSPKYYASIPTEKLPAEVQACRDWLVALDGMKRPQQAVTVKKAKGADMER